MMIKFNTRLKINNLNDKAGSILINIVILLSKKGKSSIFICFTKVQKTINLPVTFLLVSDNFNNQSKNVTIFVRDSQNQIRNNFLLTDILVLYPNLWEQAGNVESTRDKIRQILIYKAVKNWGRKFHEKRKYVQIRN